MTTFLHRGGGYRNLRAYQLSEVVYDLTTIFVERFIEKGSRTKDQMVQAARQVRQVRHQIIKNHERIQSYI